MKKRKSVGESIELRIQRPSKEVETFECLICTGCKPMNFVFKHKVVPTNNNQIITCTNKFCIDCISNHINAKVHENISMIQCPDLACKNFIDFDSCFGIIPKSVLDRWEDVMSKSKVLEIAKLYCPFKACSAPLVPADHVTTPKAKCPHCRKYFCTQCNVAWHEEMECTEFQKQELSQTTEDISFKNLAKDKGWRRCPHCKFYVEKIEGCHHIRCRCGLQFCYGCGLEYENCKGCSDYSDDESNDGSDDESNDDSDDKSKDDSDDESNDKSDDESV